VEIKINKKMKPPLLMGEMTHFEIGGNLFANFFSEVFNRSNFSRNEPENSYQSQISPIDW